MKRRNPRGCQLVRGFLLGMLYAKGHAIATARIRKDLRVSKATAKRDLKALAVVVPVSPSQPVKGLRNHIPKRAVLR